MADVLLRLRARSGGALSVARPNGKADAVISRAVAEDIHRAALSEGSQMFWRIEIDRGEHAGKYIARPILVRGGRPSQMSYILLGETLEDVQVQIPSGLQRVTCQDPLVVEEWIEA